MVADRIENFEKYTGLSEKIAAALKYLYENDFQKVSPGRYAIDGDDMFFIVSDYQTRKANECHLEAHQKYIDVQYMEKGEEWIGYAPLENQVPLCPYNDETDLAFFEGADSFIKLKKGMFAIFFPEDLHMPGTADVSSPVRKVVVKIKI
ncbi:MAG: YhcH/YjgK/YiaL family protein [Proteobacteria bacterium]|nr:YhcH/YjgK/YiaL family protein [Pseudomonadota bacterium]